MSICEKDAFDLAWRINFIFHLSTDIEDIRKISYAYLKMHFICLKTTLINDIKYKMRNEYHSHITQSLIHLFQEPVGKTLLWSNTVSMI